MANVLEDLAGKDQIEDPVAIRKADSVEGREGAIRTGSGADFRRILDVYSEPGRIWADFYKELGRIAFATTEVQDSGRTGHVLPRASAIVFRRHLPRVVAGKKRPEQVKCWLSFDETSN